MLKIATWNINSIRVRLEQILFWLVENKIDVLCLQEIKCLNENFPHKRFNEIGYSCLVNGQKAYNGVAIISKNKLSNEVLNIPNFPDEQARLLTANLNDLRIINGYFVNGQSPESDKFIYKLNWLLALRDFVKEQKQIHEKILLLGDFNIVPADLDSYEPIKLKDTILHTKQEREHFFELLNLGFFDSFRFLNPEDKTFSWWDYRVKKINPNLGLRIDFILVTNNLKLEVKFCKIDIKTRKYERPSDHAPVFLTINL